MSIAVPPPDPQLTKLFGWFFILLALPIGLFTVVNVVNTLSAPSWPGTQADILSSSIYRQTRPGQWCIKLRYRYVVDGKTYTSVRQSPSLTGGGACDRHKMVIEARLEQLQPGANIRIRYHPDRPQKATVYLTDVGAVDYLLAGITVLLIGGGIQCIREGATMARRQQARPTHSVENSTDPRYRSP